MDLIIQALQNEAMQQLYRIVAGAEYTALLFII